MLADSSTCVRVLLLFFLQTFRPFHHNTVVAGGQVDAGSGGMIRVGKPADDESNRRGGVGVLDATGAVVGRDGCGDRSFAVGVGDGHVAGDAGEGDGYAVCQGGGINDPGSVHQDALNTFFSLGVKNKQ